MFMETDWSNEPREWQKWELPALVVDHPNRQVAWVDAQVEGDAPHHNQPQFQPWQDIEAEIEIPWYSIFFEIGNLD